MLLPATLVLIFLTVSAAVISLLMFVGKRYDPAMKRLAQVEQLAANRAPAEETFASNPFAKKEMAFGLDRLYSALGQLVRRDEQKNSKLRQAMIQAGIYQENSVSFFISTKILGAVTLFLLYVFAGIVAGKSLPSILWIGLLMALTGYLLPNLVLKAKIRRRQEVIAASLSDALDFLVICVEAGLGLNAAILRVGQELQLSRKALSDELLLLNHEIRTGIPREQALRNLTQRHQVEDLKILVGALVLADKLGTSIADTLRAQSDSLRTRVRQRAEEKAAKAGIKLLFPLVFLVMPALFIVILGPGIIMLIKTLVPVLSP